MYGIQVLTVQADVNAGADNAAVVENVVKQAVDTFGDIHVLINNAQASASGVTLADHTTEQFDLAIYSGLYATFHYMKACYPTEKDPGFCHQLCLRRRSVRQLRTVRLTPSQRGHLAVSTRVAATEWGRDNINVNIVCPLAWTAQLENFQKAYPDAFEKNVKMPPVGHLGDAGTGDWQSLRSAGISGLQVHDRRDHYAGRRSGSAPVTKK